MTKTTYWGLDFGSFWWGLPYGKSQVDPTIHVEMLYTDNDFMIYSDGSYMVYGG